MKGGYLQRLGTALHAVQKRLIIRGEKIDGSQCSIPKTNSAVFDQKKVKIGRVLDIFGPVNNPYIIVKPNKESDVSVHIGKKLYIDEKSGRDSKWKR